MIAISAIGMLSLSFLAGSRWVFMGSGLTRTFGQGLIPAARIIVPRWFTRQRGRAKGMVGVASTLSIATMYGCGSVWLARIGHLGTILRGLVVTPIDLIFIRKRPEG